MKNKHKWYSFLLIGLALLLAGSGIGCTESNTKEGLDAAYDKGYSKGYTAGRDDGYRIGLAEEESAKKEAVEARSSVFFAEKDEALAGLANNKSVAEIDEELLYNYNYSSQLKAGFQAILNETLPKDSEVRFMSSTVVDSVFGMEYFSIHEKSMNAMSSLQGNGFSNAEIAFILNCHDFESWPKVARRLIASRK